MIREGSHGGQVGDATMQMRRNHGLRSRRSRLEAMARGVPVISTPCGGPEDFVTDGETGILLKTFDAVEMSEQMSRLIDSPASALKLGKAARERVVREFSIEN